jgi:cyclin D5, plant
MPWAAQLLSVACVSVAAKMEECQAPALSEFHASGFDFDSASIRRMELLVLSTLGWRMGAVTPLDFLPCFSSRVHPHGGAGAGAGGRVAIGFIFATAEGSYTSRSNLFFISFLTSSDLSRVNCSDCLVCPVFDCLRSW